MAKTSKSYDVVIIGGGPAGSAVGSYLSRAGISNVLFEAAIHPRPHVGESLVTSTTRIFDELDFLQTMEREGFVRKYGAAWHPPQKRGSLAIKFAEFPQEGIHQDYTYHVDRARFDLLLLKHAEQLGTKVYQGTPVKRVLFDDQGACGVEVEVAGQLIEVPAKIVVDASGRRTLLGNQARLKEPDRNFNQFAVHAWFEGVDRGKPDDREDIHIHFLPVKRGWVWQIPISETVTSIGAVAEKEVFAKGKGDHGAWFHELCESAPDIAKAMQNARQVTDFSVEGDYSYTMTDYCGDGFVLVGDAARFVDPIFSSGVSVALYSAKFASEAIVSALAAGHQRVSKEQLRSYHERLKKGTTVWYEFITLYYKLLPMFTLFIKKSQYRLQVLQLLQGEVFDRESVPVLDAMRKFVNAVEEAPDHMLAAAMDHELAVSQ